MLRIVEEIMWFMKKFLIVFDTIDNFDIIETLFASWAGDARLFVPSPGRTFAWATHYRSPLNLRRRGGDSFDNCGI